MTAYPWMKFFPADWRADQSLRVCGLAARGLWIEMLCVMHSAVPYGHLLINGSPASDTQLAMLTGASPDQIPVLIGELETAGVFSRTGKGVIYSRRMTRDEKRAALARKNGKAGGNPNLCNKTDNPPPDNPPDKGYVNGQDNTQTSDARQQKVEENSEAPSTINQAPFSGPSGPGKTGGFVGRTFTFSGQELAELEAMYPKVPDFLTVLGSLDAAFRGKPRPKALELLHAKLLNQHLYHSQQARRPDKQPAQKSRLGRVAL